MEEKDDQVRNADRTADSWDAGYLLPATSPSYRAQSNHDLTKEATP